MLIYMCAKWAHVQIRTTCISIIELYFKQIIRFVDVEISLLYFVGYEMIVIPPPGNVHYKYLPYKGKKGNIYMNYKKYSILSPCSYTYIFSF